MAAHLSIRKCLSKMGIYNFISFCHQKPYSSAAKQSLTLVQLNSRSLVQVNGEESVAFLQGLATNDINHLVKRSSSIYSMFLNHGGRVLYDTIVHKISNTQYLVECDTSVEQQLVKHLRLYRVRRKIDIDGLSNGDCSIWAAFLNDKKLMEPPNQPEGHETLLIGYDPRLKNVGIRIVALGADKSTVMTTLSPNYSVQEAPEALYKEHLYGLGIGEGVDDILIGKSLPLESNVDYMQGVSFHKGCYIGQELTARTHHTGVTRKRLMPVKLETSITEDARDLDIKNESDKPVGKLRRAINKQGLALLRIEPALQSAQLFVDGVRCKTERPFWWPQEVSKSK